MCQTKVICSTMMGTITNTVNKGRHVKSVLYRHLAACLWTKLKSNQLSGQSNKAFTTVNYDSTVSRVSKPTSVTRVGDFLHFGQLLKLFATMNLPKSPTFLGNFSKGAKIIDFSNEIIFGQLL